MKSNEPHQEKYLTEISKTFSVLLPFLIMIMHYNAEKCFCVGFAESLIRGSSAAFEMLTRIILFYHDYGPMHTSSVAMATILDCGLEIVLYSPYSPYLVCSNFHLFPNMKKVLTGQCFANNEVMDAVLWDPRKRVLFK